MAFTASAVWEVWATGLNTSGGGFDPGVSGFPTDGTTDTNTGNTAAPVFSSASYNFAAGDVGHWIYIKSGTNSLPGWYKIVSVASNKATLNATIGTAVLAAGTPTTVVGLATVGTPTSLTWGIDYSQSATAKIAFTDMVIGGTTTTFTSAANPVGKNFIGNVINVVSGTGFTVQRVAIVSTSGTTATCDKSLGTGGSTGGTGNLGGAFLSPALPYSIIVNSNKVFIKTGAYSITSTSSNVAGGVIVNAAANTRTEGYEAVRGDGSQSPVFGNMPVLTASGIATIAIVTSTSNFNTFINFKVDGASLTTLRGFILTGGVGYKLWTANCTNSGFINSSTTPNLTSCRATGCSGAGAGFTIVNAHLCVADGNTVTGFSGCNTTFCLSYNNTGASTDGFSLATNALIAINCIAYGNGRHGINANSLVRIINFIAESNSGTGVLCTGTGSTVINIAAYLNGTNTNISGAGTININPITPTASTFVAPGSGNFALNANAGGGAALRAAGIPGVTPDGLSTGYLDIGSIQSPPLFPPARSFTWSN